MLFLVELRKYWRTNSCFAWRFIRFHMVVPPWLIVNLFSLFTDPTDCFAAEGVKNARKGGGFKEAG